MLNNIPIIGWIIDIIVKISLAIPFWIVWELLGIGETFFYFLPDVYHRPGFWNTVGVFMVSGILVQFSPFKSNVSQTNSIEEEG